MVRLVVRMDYSPLHTFVSLDYCFSFFSATICTFLELCLAELSSLWCLRARQRCPPFIFYSPSNSPCYLCPSSLLPFIMPFSWLIRAAMMGTGNTNPVLSFLSTSHRILFVYFFIPPSSLWSAPTLVSHCIWFENSTSHFRHYASVSPISFAIGGWCTILMSNSPMPLPSRSLFVLMTNASYAANRCCLENAYPVPTCFIFNV